MNFTIILLSDVTLPCQITQNKCNPAIIPEVEVCITTIDVVKSYSKSQKNLKIAVTVLDENELPIFGCEVSLVVISPSGRKGIKKRGTDHHGVAVFSINSRDSGFWDIIVSDVFHPFFNLQVNRDSQRLLVIEF